MAIPAFVFLIANEEGLDLQFLFRDRFIGKMRTEDLVFLLIQFDQITAF